MKIDINRMCVVHLPNRDNIIALFDDSEEALKFSRDFEESHNLKSSVDPLFAFLCQTRGRAEALGVRKR